MGTFIFGVSICTFIWAFILGSDKGWITFLKQYYTIKRQRYFSMAVTTGAVAQYFVFYIVVDGIQMSGIFISTFDIYYY